MNRRANPVLQFFKESRAAKATVLLLLGIVALAGIVVGSPERNVPKGDVLEHIRWIDHHVFENLPYDHWEVRSVTQSKAAEIAIEVVITDPQHIQLIKSMKRMARVAILNQVCPKPGSGVEDILEMGWKLWVVLKTTDEKLTGGTCHYQTPENK